MIRLVFVIISVILMIIGGILWFRRNQLEQEVSEIKETETSTVRELQELAQKSDEEISESGSFSQQVEVKGITKSHDPLTADISKKPCVYCHTIITERYREEVEFENDEGEIETELEEKEEEVSNETKCIDFLVEDETGSILVSPDEETQIEGIKTIDRYEPSDEDEFEIEIGNFEIELPMPSDGTLGYYYEEIILPLETQIYVLGEASNADGQLKIHQPSDEESSFIITHQSEEDLLKDKRNRIKNYTIGSSLTFFFGVGLFIFVGINWLTS